jgi:DNA modification methylase
MLRRENITPDDLVVDPFVGSGTTLVVCKQHGVPSLGIDANDFMVDAARVKLNWQIDLESLKKLCQQVLNEIYDTFECYHWGDSNGNNPQQLPLFNSQNGEKLNYQELVNRRRPEMLLEKYISDRTFAKLLIIDDIILSLLADNSLKSIFDLALSSIIVPASNVQYGPGFGIGKAKMNVDVYSLYKNKIQRMVADLEATTTLEKLTPSKVLLGDARKLTNYIEPNSISLMITSPPYPGDHEYTKHTRLELIFRNYARDLKEFRVIKKRMLTASTTNIYKEDDDGATVADMRSIQKITALIEERLKHDGATSGFEKLYSRLVWEYFGGMYKTLFECFVTLKPNGKIALLVSDSHAFKMTHIRTADILREIGERIGYVNCEILLWQLKTTTSHRYHLRENILILQKPG